jgi:selenocysteine-specific elongation factor
VEAATAGLRVGINLQGLEKAIIERGNVIVPAQTLKPTSLLDVVFQLLPGTSKPFKNRTRVRLHAGTVEVLARAVLLNQEEIKPGEKAYLQLRLEEPVAALPGDRFVIRSYSPVFTIGGGEILDAFPSRHKRLSPLVQEEMATLENGSEDERVKLRLFKAGAGGLSWAEMVMRSNQLPSRLKPMVDSLVSRGGLLRFNGERLRYLHPQIMADLKRFTLDYLKEFHQKNPLQAGAGKEELKSKLPPQVDARLFNHLLSILTEEKKISLEKETVRLSSHTISLKEEEKDLRKKIIVLFSRGKLQPPTVKETLVELGVPESELKPVLQLLTKENVLVKVKEDLYFHRQALEELEGKVVHFLRENKEMAPPQFKDLSQVSRKFAIPLLEHFDGKKLTMRIGDKRVLRK